MHSVLIESSVLAATNDEQLVKDLFEEDEIDNHLLIVKPVDYYHNLTLKIIFLLAWTETNCPTHSLLHVGDDTFVNI